MLCCVPRNKNCRQKSSSETHIYHNQNALDTCDYSPRVDTEGESAPIPTLVLTSEEIVQNEGNELKTQENEGHSSISPMSETLEVPTRKSIQRSPCLTHVHQFEGAGVKGDNYTERDGPLSIASASLDSSTTSSYQTASSGLTHDHSPTSAGGLPVKDPMILIQSMKDELLQGMKEAFEKRMTEIEQKVETCQCRLEARVEEVEKQLQEMHRESRSLCNEVNKVQSAAGLATVREGSEDDEDEKISTTSSSQLSQNSHIVTTSQRRYTDSKAMEMAQHKKIQRRRQDFAKRKSQSLHYSQLFQKPCNQQVIMWLTQRVTNWKFLGRWLGLPENVLSRIEADNQKSDREQCYQMFLRWKESDPENYTYPVLGDVLRKESQELYYEFVEEVHRVENKIVTCS